MSNKAKEIIIPASSRIFRIVFLYVGQGNATLLLVPDGEAYKYILIDSHRDESSGGIDLLRLLKDLFTDERSGLDLYINTHPHKDHLARVKDIYEEIGIEQLWHSGHKPGGEHKESYEDLEYVIKDLGAGNVFVLTGSREDNKLDEQNIKLGDINYNVLAPAEHVTNEIEDEKPEDRYRRIHEQCGVIRFKYGRDEKQVLITGDADYDAWKEHITNYHMERLPSFVLSAPHHGSNSFFWKDSNIEEDVYKEHLDNIDPTYIIVSAPKKSESKHGHPDTEAMNLYKEQTEKHEGAVFHLGKNKECVIVDISEDGGIEIHVDDELVKEYGIDQEKDNGGSTNEVAAPAVVLSKLDKKPMGLA